MPVPARILELVERFDAQKESYLKSNYGETEVRREFIDPFFSELGWNMDNSNGRAEAYKEVIHEDKVLVGTSKKAPDYSFRIGGIRKFFVEAKKPSVSIKLHAEPAFQVRRYGWSAGLPVCIVTDFEEFAVYDTTIQPQETDSPKTARIFYCTYKEYSEKWDEIAGLFSQDSILNGAFDKFNKKKRKGTETVDVAFLEEIETWRLALAQNIFKHHPTISQPDLNSAVQSIIDRIVFLRICEDRGIEPEDRLKQLGSKKDIFKGLVRHFKDADAKYNSGLFHFAEEKGRKTDIDTLTPKLVIDDDVLKDIFDSLYFPASYEFSVIPADILGQVYERFLGNIITIGSDNVSIEEKPEVRKAGGVYYTPSYIVDYIVQNTLGAFLKNMTPTQAEKLRIIDPACGSGSFLIVAYQYLLDWHLNFYVKHYKDPAKNKTYQLSKRVYFTDKGIWKLTLQERKRILLNNIHGVDIDPQAVEVTKLSLLLKVAELDSNADFLNERMLPDLDRNIQRGNSLIDSDFYSQKNMPAITKAERDKLNTFDWKDAFPGIFKEGGFDVVIGNPPYVTADFMDDMHTKYILSRFPYLKQLDLYQAFCGLAERLVNKTGIWGFIIPDALLARDETEELRRFLLQNNQSITLSHVGSVFAEAVVSCIVMLCSKTKESAEKAIRRADITEYSSKAEEALTFKTALQDDFCTFSIHATPDELHLIRTLRKNGRKLNSLTSSISRGEEMGKKQLKENRSHGDVGIISGDNIAAFCIKNSARFIPRNLIKKDVYAQPKVVVTKTGKYPIAATDLAGRITLQTLYNIVPRADVSPFLIEAILNSNLIKWYLFKTVTAYKLIMPQLNQRHIDDVPVPKAFPDALIREIVDIAQRLHTLTEDDDAPQNAPLIKGARKRLNQLIYQLYSLSDIDIQLIESNLE